MLMVNQLCGFGASGSTKAVSYRTTAESNSSLTTYTFSTQDLGAASADRYVAVGLLVRKVSPAASISSATIGGVSATVVKSQASADGDLAAILIAAVPTGATGDVVINFASAPIRILIGIWALTGLNGDGAAEATAGSTASPLNLNLTATAGAVVLGVAFSQGNSTFTWAGLTEDFDPTITGGPNGASGASIVSAGGAMTITATASSSTNPCGVSASFF